MSAWGLVHLTVDQSDLRCFVFQRDDTRLNHLVVKIVTLTGTFTDSSEDGVTTMGLSDVVNQFHNQHSLSDTSTTEETNFASLGVGGEKIDDLNSSDKNILRHVHFNELWSFSVKRAQPGRDSAGPDPDEL